MKSHERRDYLYDVLARQPMNPIPMKIIRNSKKALNQKFETHYNDMSRINNALRQLEKLGKIKRNISMERVVSKKHPQGIEFPVVFSIEVKKD